MATLITTTAKGKPVHRVRWNYRDPSIDGRPYDQQQFSRLEDALAHKERVEASPGIVTGRGRMLDVVTAYLASSHYESLSIRTREDTASVCRIHILPAFGKKKVERITTGDVKAWIDAMLREGYPHLAPSGKRRPGAPVEVPTANKALRIARAIMKWARTEDGMPATEAFQLISQRPDRRPSSERRSQPRAYTDAEIDQLVAGCATLMEATIILCGRDSGLRRQELFALHWDDIDFDAGTVHVQRAVTRGGVYKPPKVYEERIVPVWEDGMNALREWRKHAPKLERVFNEPDGSPCDELWESRHAGKIVTRSPGGTRGRPGEKVQVLTDGIRKRSGIHLELGHLRDTYVAELIAQGCTAEEITLAVGHESVETTIRHYASWLAPRMTSVKLRVDAARAARRHPV